MPNFDVHTDGSAIWLDCRECEVTAVEALSLPASFDELIADSLDHECGAWI